MSQEESVVAGGAVWLQGQHLRHHGGGAAVSQVGMIDKGECFLPARLFGAGRQLIPEPLICVVVSPGSSAAMTLRTEVTLGASSAHGRTWCWRNVMIDRRKTASACLNHMSESVV